jgi:hypothetical protein
MARSLPHCILAGCSTKDPPPLKEVAKGLANAYGVRDRVRYLILGLKQPQAGINERLRRYVCPRLALISKYIDAVLTGNPVSP